MNLRYAWSTISDFQESTDTAEKVAHVLKAGMDVSAALSLMEHKNASPL
jgi:hypothetical protein